MKRTTERHAIALYSQRVNLTVTYPLRWGGRHVFHFQSVPCRSLELHARDYQPLSSPISAASALIYIFALQQIVIPRRCSAQCAACDRNESSRPKLDFVPWRDSTLVDFSRKFFFLGKFDEFHPLVPVNFSVMRDSLKDYVGQSFVNSGTR